MKAKVVARLAEVHIISLAQYIALNNVDAAERFTRAVYQTFFDWSEEVLPVRAHEKLPKHVRKIFVKGFERYTLFVSFRDDKIILLSAFGHGLSDRTKIAQTRLSLKSDDFS